MEFAKTASLDGADNSCRISSGRGVSKRAKTPSGSKTPAGVLFSRSKEETVHVLVQMSCVAAGSMLGGLLRWGVGVCFASWFGTGFPWGTFFINVSGSLFLGWFLTLLRERLTNGLTAWISPDHLHLMIA